MAGSEIPSEDIMSILRPHAERDVNEIYDDAAPLAAAFIVAVATGQITSATVQERLTAARDVINRNNGTPIAQDVKEANAAAQAAAAVMERVKRIEAARTSGALHVVGKVA